MSFDLPGEDHPELSRWIVRSTTDGLWVFDQQGRTTWANDRMAEMLGRSPEEMVGLRVVDTLDEAGGEQLLSHLADLAADGTAEENRECSLLRKDGSRIWALVSHSPLIDDEGRNRGWLHRVTELTDRKKLLDRLRASEQQLAEAQAIAKVGSWDWDIRSDVVTWSDELFRMLGISPEELDATFHGIVARVHPDDQATVVSAVEAALAGSDTFDFEVRTVMEGGAEGWMRGRGLVACDDAGTPIRMHGTAQDITEAVRTAQALELASTRLRVLLALTAAANQASSLTEAVEVALAQFKEHTSWLPRGAFRVAADGTLTPMTLAGVPGVGEPDREVREAAETGDVVWRWDGTAEHVPQPGRTGVLALPVTLEGRPVCVVALTTPPGAAVSAQTREAVGQVCAQLARVAEREQAAAQLAEARDTAMQASRLKSEFLATMSHEIRTPLNGVLGLTELLLRTPLTSQQRRLGDGIERAGRTLLTLVNDILDLSKIEAGKIELESVDFDVREVVSHVTGLMADPAADKALELLVACDPSVPAVLRGDPVRFGQVLTNLVSNAMKFTDVGEVVVQVGVAQRNLDRVVLRVDVRDTGIGIAEESQPRLFDAFTQADASTTREYGGTGLGLTIARQLVHALGGEIGFTSTPGEGSTFWFTAAFQASAAGESPPARHRLQGLRALVVDDNETNLFILRQQLEVWGVETELAPSAGHAMGLLRERAAQGRPFEVALVDLCMPGTDGLGLTELVRAHRDLADLPVMLLTSVGHVDELALRRLRVGACLDKPVLYSDLLDALTRLLDGPSDFALPQRPSGAGRSGRTRPRGTVLVVEDNPLNHIVARGMLETLGYEVAVAEDGLEAVRAAAGEHDYAAVLMDIQMPRMDGYDATRAIRAQEVPSRRVPIIAMTASAVAGEHQRCLEVGMDDFLVKPIDLERLGPTMRRWTQPGDSSEPEPADEPRDEPGADAAHDVLDRERLEMLQELKPGDLAMFHRLLDSFLGSADGDLAELAGSVEEGDGRLVFERAHRLKGRALNIGVPRVARVAQEIEDAGERGDLGTVTPLVADLRHELDRAVRALRDVREGGL